MAMMTTLHRRTFLIAAAVGPMALAAAERHAAETPAAGATEPPAAAPATAVPVIGRRAWGALAPRSGRERHRPVRLTLHHSGVRLTDPAAAPGRVRQHQRFHMLEKGHPDIDYHYLVDRRGNVYEGRDPSFRGDTQTDYDPTGHLLVCCEGDYQGTTGRPQRPTPKMLRAVAGVFAATAQRWDIDPASLGGHRDYTKMTSCPGGALQQLLRDGSLAERVERLMMAGEVQLDILATRQGRRAVRRIERA